MLFIIIVLCPLLYVMWVKALNLVYFYICSLVINVSAIRILNCECGKANFLVSQRIIGGTNLDEHKYPWMVNVVFNPKNSCGGVIINDLYILTTAHCFERRDNLNFKVLIGSHISTDGTIYKPIKLTKHKRYKLILENNYIINDIAIIKLDRRILFDSRARPICLPNPSSDYSKHYGTVIGWGIHETGEKSKTLREVELQIMTDEYCRNSEIFYRYGNSMICAFSENRDSCQGDSGGPLMYENSKEEYELIGLVSWGIECADSAPGVYTKVSKFINWIQKHTQDASYCGRS